MLALNLHPCPIEAAGIDFLRCMCLEASITERPLTLDPSTLYNFFAFFTFVCVDMFHCVCIKTVGLLYSWRNPSCFQFSSPSHIAVFSMSQSQSSLPNYPHGFLIPISTIPTTARPGMAPKGLECRCWQQQHLCISWPLMLGLLRPPSHTLFHCCFQ